VCAALLPERLQQKRHDAVALSFANRPSPHV
jgi:hypothetical protein